MAPARGGGSAPQRGRRPTGAAAGQRGRRPKAAAAKGGSRRPPPPTGAAAESRLRQQRFNEQIQFEIGSIGGRNKLENPFPNTDISFMNV